MESGRVRYYCTAGSGMEPFLIEEVTKALSATDVCRISGKVLFSSTSPFYKVTELKSAERLFLLLKHEPPLKLPSHTSPAKVASVLQSTLLGDRSLWTGAALTWSRLQGEVADRKTAVNRQRVGRAAGEEEEERRREEWTDEEGRVGEQEEKSETSRVNRGEEGETLEQRRKRGLVLEERCGDGLEVLEKKMKIGDLDEDCTVETNVNVKAADRGDPHLQLSRNKDVSVSFRISCKCTGPVSHYFSSAQEVAKVIGLGLSRLLGWKADLKNPQLEVHVSISDDHCLLGVPLTKSSLANRSYIRTTGLRSTVAWVMASLAQIQPGSCVVDPMCGVGTILIEAAQEHKDVCFLGVDIDDGQLQKASDNVEFAGVVPRIHLLKASSMALPLPSSSVDAVICDLPFGRKFGSKANMAANLPVILTEMERILRVRGSLVLLLSPQLSCLLKKILAQRETGAAFGQETMEPSGKQDCTSSSLSAIKQQTALSQEDSTPTGTGPSSPPARTSLTHWSTHRISLGAIDGLLHKYVKI